MGCEYFHYKNAGFMLWRREFAYSSVSELSLRDTVSIYRNGLHDIFTSFFRIY